MDFASQNLTAGQLNAIVKKLGGHEGALRFLRGELIMSSAAPKSFPVWKTIQIGGKSKGELLAELKSNGFYVSDWEKDIMSKPAFKISEPQTINLARVKVRDLGFKKEPTTSELWARIRELGHDLCPPDAGPHIRLAFPEQERGDRCWVATEQITHSGGGLVVFGVGGRRWLFAGWVHPGIRWALGNVVVFVLRK